MDVQEILNLRATNPLEVQAKLEAQHIDEIYKGDKYVERKIAACRASGTPLEKLAERRICEY